MLRRINGKQLETGDSKVSVGKKENSVILRPLYLIYICLYTLLNQGKTRILRGVKKRQCILTGSFREIVSFELDLRELKKKKLFSSINFEFNFYHYPEKRKTEDLC